MSGYSFFFSVLRTNVGFEILFPVCGASLCDGGTTLERDNGENPGGCVLFLSAGSLVLAVLPPPHTHLHVYLHACISRQISQTVGNPPPLRTKEPLPELFETDWHTPTLTHAHTHTYTTISGIFSRDTNSSSYRFPLSLCCCGCQRAHWTSVLYT